jgi:hypothetical protein
MTHMPRTLAAAVALAGLLLAGCTPAVTTAPPLPTSAPTAAPTATAGIPIQGYVRLNSSTGPGLADVQVYARGGYGSTEGPARLLATTDADGFYWNGNAIPGMVVWVELAGYVFEPATQQYMGGEQSCTDACDFVGRPGQ